MCLCWLIEDARHDDQISTAVKRAVKSKYPALIVFLLCLTSYPRAQSARATNINAEAVTVICTLRNGDRVTGHAPTIADGALSLETDYLGRAALRAEALTSCETNDAALRGRINELIASSPVTTDADEKDAPPLTITAAATAPKDSGQTKQPLAPNKTSAAQAEGEWKKTVAFSYNFARGNTDVSDLNISSGVEHKTRDGRFAVQSFLRRGTKNGEDFARLFTSTARYEHKMAGDFLSIDNVSFFNELGYESDALKKLDHRMIWNGGMQFPLIKTEASDVALDVGGGITREIYESDGSRTLGAGLLRLKSEQTIFGHTKIAQQIAAFPDFAEVGRYRLQADLSVTAPISKIFSVRIGALNRFDNKPQEAVKRNDFSLLSGLVVNF